MSPSLAEKNFMKIKSATLIIDSCQTPDVAKAMFRFWDWQYIETQKETIVARAALVGVKTQARTDLGVGKGIARSNCYEGLRHQFPSRKGT